MKPYGFSRAPEPILMSGIKPSRFGGSTCNTRTGATAAITAGVAGAGVAACVSAGSTAAEVAALAALIFNAAKSALVSTPLSRKSNSTFLRTSGMAAPARLAASDWVRRPLLTKRLIKGSLPGRLTVGLGLAAVVAAADVAAGVAAAVLAEP